jgi:uncharacterized protein YbaR (Trm112 family)
MATIAAWNFRSGLLSDHSGNPAKLNLNQTMPISKDLLDILVCPLCKATVELKPDQSGLKCVQCKRVYPIRDEIPVMLIDEAKIEE